MRASQLTEDQLLSSSTISAADERSLLRSPGTKPTYKPRRYTKKVRDVIHHPEPQPIPVEQETNVSGQEPLTASMLSGAQHHEQKQMLGERLYPHIQVKYYF